MTQVVAIENIDRNTARKELMRSGVSNGALTCT
jgi:hypothetical protein